ncbi:MAG: hypothetical protein EP318_18790 [Rhodobacteraceae bacterium]|nr:MAG: hypothetical protein EP318_18790 [Paracoccaceae bacterium]
MTDPADTRFFQALLEACQHDPKGDAELREAIARALETGDPLDMRAARKALDAQENSMKDRILRQVHLRMATDLSAIWDALPGAPGNQRPN